MSDSDPTVQQALLSGLQWIHFSDCYRDYKDWILHFSKGVMEDAVLCTIFRYLIIYISQNHQVKIISHLD